MQIYKLEIRISKHDLAKLEAYANAVLDDNEIMNVTSTISSEFSIANVRDVTDILENMLVSVESSRLLTLTEKFIETLQNIHIIDTALFRYLMSVFIIGVKYQELL